MFDQIHDAILCRDIDAKCKAAEALYKDFDADRLDHALAVTKITTPGLPESLNLVPPRELKRRGMAKQSGRNTLMHAIAHIEFNAINLALDAAYRFRDQPSEFYRDWLSIAADEARHFLLVREYLNAHDCEYGDYPVHNGLWEMAVDTDYDVMVRMALVPRVLEARGLDVTPSMISRLNGVGDKHAVDILNVIYEEEIGHVAIGSKWFHYHCKKRDLEPRSTFIQLVDKHLHGQLRGPFNRAARLLAGFDEQEIARLEAKL